MPSSQINPSAPITDSIASRRHLPVVSAALGAFVVATACWIGIGLFTAGDFFASGRPLPLLVVALAVAAAAGGYGGYRTRSRSLRGLIAVAAVACGVFWAAAPGGWWALPPPSETEVRPP